jgi:FlaA1/EpsC-like NDP-sugar epimerase
MSAKLIAIVALEALVFALAIRLGISVSQFSGVPDVETWSPMPIAIFALGMVIVMNAAGLYSASAWRDKQSVRVRIIAAALLLLVLIYLITHLPLAFVMEPRGFVITVAAIFLGVTLVRFTFYKWDKQRSFKPRVLVLGTGSRVS